MGAVTQMDFVIAVLHLAAFGLAALTLAGSLGRRWWGFDLASHFRTQYLVGLALVAVLLLVFGRWVSALLCIPFLAINLAAVGPFLWQTVHAEVRRPGMRLLSANVLKKNTAYGRLLAQIQTLRPDFVALCEPNQAWINGLAALEPDYPYRYFSVREDNYGLALYSRLPFAAVEARRFGPKDVPSVVAQVQTEQGPLTLVVTHPPPPKSRRMAEQRNLALADLAEYTAGRDHATILCGDLNISPWSPFFEGLLRRGRLSNSAVGYGLQTSWPADYRFFLRIPIDHCLVSPQVQTLNRFTGRPFGSDHFPVILDFAIHN